MGDGVSMYKCWSLVVWGMVSVHTRVGLEWCGGRCQYVQVLVLSGMGDGVSTYKCSFSPC